MRAANAKNERKQTRRRKAAKEAVQRLRERAKRQTFGHLNWDEWKTYRDEGRR